MGNMFAYARVSTVKQGEKGVSLQEQRDAILRYAQQHGLHVNRWFEETETASKLGRPAFSQMLRLLRLGHAAGVIIHKIDRSARNLHDWADVSKLVDAGIDVRFANESLDLTTVGGRLSADIQAVVAAHYSRNLREEAKKGFYGRLKQGFYPMRAPIGYLDQGAAKPKVKDPVRAPLVVQAFQLYQSGCYSLPCLTREMHERGLRNQYGGPVTMTAIAKMLTNPFYAGVIRLKKTSETFSGNHEALVNQAVFEEVQVILHGKAVDRVVKHRFTFSRIVRCASCGYSLIGERKKGHVYYRCHNRPFKNPAICPPTAIREEQLEAAVMGCLDKVALTEEEVRYARRWIEERRANSAEERTQQHRNVQLQLEAIRNRLGQLTDLLIDGTVEKAVFEEKKSQLLWQEAKLKQQIDHLEQNDLAWTTELEKFVELAKSPSLLYQKADQVKKRELLRILLSNLAVSGKNVTITMKIPFTFLLPDKKSDDGGPARGTCRTWARLLEKLRMHFSENPAALSGVDQEKL